VGEDLAAGRPQWSDSVQAAVSEWLPMRYHSRVDICNDLFLLLKGNATHMLQHRVANQTLLACGPRHSKLLQAQAPVCTRPAFAAPASP
jgi:hypothetical protein